MTTISKPMNITFEIVTNKEDTKLVTFYSIDALTSKGKNAVIISGGKEWLATSTYEELWEKIKNHLNESTTRI